MNITDKNKKTIKHGDTLRIDGRGEFKVKDKDGVLCLEFKDEKIGDFISKNCTVIKSAQRFVPPFNPPYAGGSPKIEKVEDGLKDPFEETSDSFDWKKKK